MKVFFETVAADHMPYPTAGDWSWLKDGSLRVRALSNLDQKSALLVLVHEFLEAILCRTHGVCEDQVTAFDKDHPECEEPGDEVAAPYNQEHSFAMAIERLLAVMLRIPWKTHEANLSAAVELCWPRE